MSKLVITESFHAVQGEGVWTGHPSFFLRTAGCGVKCPACDTIYSWNKERPDGVASGQYMEIDSDDIVMQIVESGLRFVVVTGGEPAEQAAELLDVVQHSQMVRRWFTIETSGNVAFDPTPYHLLSCSPKMSGMMRRQVGNERYTGHLPQMIHAMLAAGKLVQLKYVITNEQDFLDAKNLTWAVVPQDCRRNVNVLFQPNNAPFVEAAREQELADYCANLRQLTEAFTTDVKKGGMWEHFPLVRLQVQQHWLSHGREKGT
jgi:7-carboxy-7-deazaguanine synthase